jgi:hypothetical protein
MANTSISKSNGECVIAHEPISVKNHLLYITDVSDPVTHCVYTHGRVINSDGKTIFSYADFKGRESDSDVYNAAYKFINKHPNLTQLCVLAKWAKRWEKAPRADRLFIGRSEL